MSNFLSSLYILDISPLSDVGLVKIFSHSVDYIMVNDFFFKDMVLFCSPGCPRTQYVDQADFEITESACLCLVSPGIKNVCYHAQPTRLLLLLLAGLERWLSGS